MKDNTSYLTSAIISDFSNLTPEQLRAVINAAADKIDEKAKRHRIAIEQAIADAIDDGFDVSFWVEGTKDCCVMCHDETDRIKHVRVN